MELANLQLDALQGDNEWVKLVGPRRHHWRKTHAREQRMAECKAAIRRTRVELRA